MEDHSSKDPFLADYEKDLDNLNNDFKIFCLACDDLEKSISMMSSNEPSSIQKVEDDFKKIKSKIDEINKEILRLKNFINENQPKYYKKLCSISDRVLNKYSQVKVKFEEIYAREQQNIQNGNNYEAPDIYNSPMGGQRTQTQILVSKNAYSTNSKIQRLLLVRSEYESINETTKMLAQITRDMKETSERQNKTINSISDSIITVDTSAAKANQELLIKNKKEQEKSSKGYIILSIVLVIIVLGIIWYLYHQYTN
ncbi:MAG: hypothetical protein MJ252_14410 [archaeon]|nr:hypothetical protein [archaeon]